MLWKVPWPWPVLPSPGCPRTSGWSQTRPKSKSWQPRLKIQVEILLLFIFIFWCSQLGNCIFQSSIPRYSVRKATLESLKFFSIRTINDLLCPLSILNEFYQTVICFGLFFRRLSETYFDKLWMDDMTFESYYLFCL